MSELKTRDSGKPAAVQAGKVNGTLPGQDLGRKEQEVETKNIAKPGDKIVMAATSASGEPVVWVVLPKQFAKAYEAEKGEEHPVHKGFHKHRVKPETRTAVLVSSEVLLLCRDKFGEETPSQADFHAFVKGKVTSGEIKLLDVQKVDHVYVKEVDADTEVVTRVKKGNEPRLKFKAAWGEDMPVAENDLLIYNQDEVYRIARAEFDKTYVIK